MTIKLSDLKKLEATSAPRAESIAAGEPVTVIIKVEREDYVPPGVDVRSRIDKMLFTASAPMAVIEGLERDPLVKSVAFPESIRPAGSEKR
jgi:hypothetical protein